MLVYWELTRACELACRHCRAEAVPSRHPLELTTEEGYRLLDRLAVFGDPLPHLVLTGGDPLQRPELFDYIAQARKLGFKVAVTPAGTQALTAEVVQSLKDAGVWMAALSLDGSSAERHDGIRGVPGSFEATVAAAHLAGRVGLPLQINTLVSAQTLHDLPTIYDRLVEIGVAQWALFFLIQVGRGAVLSEVTPRQSERLMEWVHEIAGEAAFRIRTTEAPFYRRVAIQKGRNGGSRPGGTSEGHHARAASGVWDGNGVMFISDTGHIHPSGFLPLNAGNVRRDDPVEVYRRSRLFTAVRNTSLFKGKCGRCEYRNVCGGSRARAYAATGDPLESDPLCPYEPASQHSQSAVGAIA